MFNVLRQKLFGREVSKSLAKSRLHVVLVQDRAGLSNEEMVEFRRELMQVIERYFIIQERDFDIKYRREGETTTLLINSPVVVKRHTPAERRTPRAQAVRRRKRRRLMAPADGDPRAEND